MTIQDIGPQPQTFDLEKATLENTNYGRSRGPGRLWGPRRPGAGVEPVDEGALVARQVVGVTAQGVQTGPVDLLAAGAQGVDGGEERRDPLGRDGQPGVAQHGGEPDESPYGVGRRLGLRSWV